MSELNPKPYHVDPDALARHDFEREDGRVSGVAGVVFGLAALAIVGVILFVVGKVTNIF